MKKLASILQTLGLVGLASFLVGGGAFFVSCLICIFGIIGMFVYPYALNSWLVYFGKAAQIVWWHGFLLGFILGFTKLRFLGIVFAIATWIAMMFLK